jgi:uncharacterized protein YndB with AHSA1/START domain
MKDTATAGITITRTFDAPRERVFKAWTEPARFAAWFGTRDATVPVESVSMDVRPGGAWKATMHTGDGQQIDWHGTFNEVDEPERLVMTMSDRPGDEYELLTVTFADVGGRTEMVFRQTGGHMDEADYEQAKAGWMAFFDCLAEDVQD